MNFHILKQNYLDKANLLNLILKNEFNFINYACQNETISSSERSFLRTCCI